MSLDHFGGGRRGKGAYPSLCESVARLLVMDAKQVVGELRFTEKHTLVDHARKTTAFLV